MLLWKERPSEIANLLNPAFGAVLIHQFIDGYQEISGENSPYIFIYIVLPLILHAQTRSKLPKVFNPKTKLIAFLHKYPEIKADLPSRIISIEPISLEAFIFGLSHQLFQIDELGRIENTGKKINRQIWNKESEPFDCFTKAKLLGKILANTGNVSTVCIMLGITP